MNKLDVTDFHLHCLCMIVDDLTKERGIGVSNIWIAHMTKLLTGQETDIKAVERYLNDRVYTNKYFLLTYLGRRRATRQLIMFATELAKGSNDQTFASLKRKFLDDESYDSSDESSEEEEEQSHTSGLDTSSRRTEDVVPESDNGKSEEGNVVDPDKATGDNDAFADIKPWSSPISSDDEE